MLTLIISTEERMQSYFGDGSTCRRVVAFTERQIFEGFQGAKKAQELKVKHGLHGGEMEIVIKTSS